MNKSVKSSKPLVGADNGLPTQGLQVMGEWYGCPRNSLLRDAPKLKATCLQLVREVGLRSVGDIFYQFDRTGVVGSILLVESHFTVHTWPDTGFVSADLYMSSDSQVHRAKALRIFNSLKAILKPSWPHCVYVVRGVPQDQRVA